MSGYTHRFAAVRWRRGVGRTVKARSTGALELPIQTNCTVLRSDSVLIGIDDFSRVFGAVVARRAWHTVFCLLTVAIVRRVSTWTSDDNTLHRNECSNDKKTKILKHGWLNFALFVFCIPGIWCHTTNNKQTRWWAKPEQIKKLKTRKPPLDARPQDSNVGSCDRFWKSTTATFN